MKIRLTAVKVVDRHRNDLGDIDALAKSIADVGLIHPITITADGRLITGQRRLEACRKLGWPDVPALVADDLDAAVRRLRTERDENTERKPMTPEELVSLGKVLEELERPYTEQRLHEAKVRAGKIRQGIEQPADGSREPSAGRTVDRVADALGVSRQTYDRAKAVVAAAADTTLDPADQQTARDALKRMNTTGQVAPSYETIRKVRDSRLGARTQVSVVDAGKQRRAIASAIGSLSGLTYGLGQIGDINPQITKEEAAQWVDDLSKARRVIEILIKRLKERTQ